MDADEFFLKRKESVIQNYYCHQKSLLIWGAGIRGRELCTILEKYDCLDAFIDNDPQKQTDGCHGKKVISFEEYIRTERTGIIVIAATEDHTEAIREQLLCLSKVENVDFFTAESFLNKVLPLIAYYVYDDMFVSLSQISLTERCTLKCKNCAHGCYNVESTSKDLCINKVKRSADFFFDKVDFAGEFVLIGGEPLLYTELKEAVAYIGERYRAKIGLFTITTNGTITPNDDVLEVCKRYDVLFRISNYSHTLPRLQNNYQRLCEKLDSFCISYVLGKAEANWIDYGFGTFVRDDETDLMSVFRSCGTPCREVRENRFYYCVMARSISENLNMNIGENDFFDLESIGSDEKEALLRYQLGYFEKGYLDMCKYCRGADARNYVIPAAEQVIE